MSEIKVDSVVNAGGDNDSGFDLSTNDLVKVNIAGSEKVRVDSTNVGIGTTAPVAKLHVESASGSITPSVHADELLVEGSGNSGITIGSGTSGLGSLRFADSGGDSQGQVGYDHSGNHMSFSTADSEAMRIDNNGTFLINKTTRTLTCKAQLTYDGSTEQGLVIENTVNSASGAGIRFVDRNGNFSGGGIYFTDSNSINYQTTSDYRLKENIVTDWDATTDLKKLKPSKFNFKNTPSKTVQGFIAHEVSNVVPEAIIGEKDGTEKYIDNDGKEKTREAYQTIDQSKLVPLLTKALQEAMERIETLEAKVTALESK